MISFQDWIRALSEGHGGAGVEISGILLADSLLILTELRIGAEDWREDSMEWAIFIFDDVADEGRNTEIGDCDTLTNKELALILALSFQLLLANGQKFG